jgi:L-gulono-1,4-lactone dehydrogenase
MTRWTNWAGNVTADVTPATPGSVAELARIVGEATARGERVKPVGAGHSFTSIAATDGIQLNLDRLAGVVRADRETGLVTVLGGTRLHALNEALWMLGLALSNLGDIDAQSIAGAISTGTHGTGARLGGLATQVAALDLVLADGSRLHCSAEENPDVFAAARVGLGALAVITSVTLQCEPAFALAASETPEPLDDVLDELDELVIGNDHFEFFWFPHTATAMVKQNNRLPADAPTTPQNPVAAFVEDELLGNAAFGVVCQLGRRMPSLIPRLNERSVRLMGSRTYTAPSHEVFTSPRRVRFVEMEYSVPRAAVHDALDAVRSVIERNGLLVSFPVEVRVTRGDDIPLSTASGRDSAYLAVHMYRGTPGYERFFRGVERELAAMDGRPHWGKLHYRSAEDLRPAYPRWDEFQAARDEADPGRLFTNEYLRRVLGP